MRPPSLVFVLLPLLAVSGAAAEDLSGSFHSTGVTRMDGTLDLTWDLAGAVLEPAPGTRLAFSLQRATLTHVNLPYEEVVLAAGAEPQRADRHTGEERVLWTTSGSGTLRFTADGISTVRIIPVDAPTAHGAGGRATILPAGTVWRQPVHGEPTPMKDLATVQGVPVAPGGRHTVVQTDALPEFDGPVHILLGGGEAAWGGRTLQTGMHRNADQSIVDPLTDSGRRSYDDRVLVVTGHLEAVEAGPDNWTLAARGVRGTLDGSIEWRGVTGAVRLNGSDLAPDPQTLRVDGALAVGSDLRASPAPWDLTGDVQAVHLDRTPLLEAAAATAGAGLLLLALLLEPVRALLSDVLARVLPLRLQSRDGAASRRRILEVVHEHQPVRVTELARHTGLSRSALRYHLRLLMRQGVLQSHAAQARNHTYMLNGGSLRFQTPTLASPRSVAADAALSVCHGHPVRRALLDRLAEGPALQDDLLEHLAVAGVPVRRSTLSHHLRRMQDARAVVAAWQDGRKTYHLDVDADAVHLEQYRRYLVGHGLLDVARTMARRPGLDRASVASLVREVPGAPDVDRLVALAILEPRGDRFRLTAPVARLVRRLGGAS